MSGRLVRRTGVLAALLSFAGGVPLEAQGRNLRFEHLSLDAGLSQSAVNAILQDRVGYLWVGTEDGLNRYDGTGFKVYKHDPDDPRSLSDSWVWALHEDAAGNLWIATRGGLSRWKPGDGTFDVFRHDPADPHSLSHDKVMAIAEDARGGLWFGTDGGGINHLEPETERVARFAHDPADPESLGHDQVTALLIDRRQRLWIATRGGGLDRHDPGTDAFVHYRQDPEDPRSLCDDRLRALAEDADGGIWIASFECGLSRLDPTTGRFENFRNDPADSRSLTAGRVRTLLRDSAGTLWAGTSGGLNALRPGARGFARYTHQAEDPRALPDDNVNALLEDRGGVLWVGTQRGGLSRCNIRTGSFPHVQAEPGSPTGLSHPYVTALHEGARESILWIGTLGGGLDQMDRLTGEFVRHRHDPGDPGSLADDRVMALLVDREQRLWVGTYGGGLDRLDPGSDRFVHYPPDPAAPGRLSYAGVMTLYEGADGMLWVGTFRGGLNRLGPSGRFDRFRNDPADLRSLSSDTVTAILEDRAGALWVGTDQGLNLLDPDSGSVVRYARDAADPDSLSHDAVMALTEGSDGTLWIGTQGGLNGWSAPDRAAGRAHFRRYTERNGLPNNWIYGILEDGQGHLWLSTNQGLSRFDPRRETFSNYGPSHGLQSSEFNFGAHHRAADGELLFGGINGFNAFYPDQISGNQHVPPVVLSAFIKFGRPVDLDGPVWELREVELGFRDYAVAFEFAALDYTDPGRNRYAHMLEGFDHDWIELGTGRRATYTNLPPGSYTLRVKASNNDGVWNEQGLSLEVRVTPAPWRTWWAYSLYALVLGGAVLAYTRSQARRLAREAEYSHKLEQQVRERTRELEEASLTDALTGLRNRRYLMTQVQEEIALMQRRLKTRPEVAQLGSCLFLMIDLDGLKPVNDRHGHAAGDRILTEMRDLLVAACRRSDTIIRWGGDEFLVVARDVDRGFAETVAERIRASVRDHVFELGGGVSVRLSCSMGFAFHPFLTRRPDLLPSDQVITIADRALYVAKRGGRDAWVGLYANATTPTDDVVQRLNRNLLALVRAGNVEISSSLGDAPALLASDALS